MDNSKKLNLFRIAVLVIKNQANKKMLYFKSKLRSQSE